MMMPANEIIKAIKLIDGVKRCELKYQAKSLHFLVDGGDYVQLSEFFKKYNQSVDGHENYIFFESLSRYVSEKTVSLKKSLEEAISVFDGVEYMPSGDAVAINKSEQEKIDIAKAVESEFLDIRNLWPTENMVFIGKIFGCIYQAFNISKESPVPLFMAIKSLINAQDSIIEEWVRDDIDNQRRSLQKGGKQ